MSGYSKHWKCERCGTPQESDGTPRVEVCEMCIGADIIVTRRLEAGNQILRDVATRAYERGYRHGKSTATPDPAPMCSCKGVVGDVGLCDGKCASISGWEDRARFAQIVRDET